jgi:signal transduction histidine kinase
MRRLYFRIYLAVLASLALFAVLVGLMGWAFWQFREPDPASPNFAFASEVAEHLLPASAGREALQKELQFWRNRTGAALVLYSPSGEVIAQAGPVRALTLTAIMHSTAQGFHWAGRGTFVVRLNDGRQLYVARPAHKLGWLSPWRWLVLLFAIGLAVAICTFPLIRRLTRNLERLEQGVAAFGQGNLTARVAVSGRDEVAKLAETFNASAARIEALIKAQKRLLANASHELRSPLARLRMAAEALGASAPEREKQEIARNIAELDALVGEILLASRLDSDAGLAARKESIDLIGVLAEECAHAQAELAAGPGGGLTVEGDGRLLHRLFRNLLDNARRYGGSAPIEAVAQRLGDKASVMVCDRGPGIPEAERLLIFEPFYRIKGHSEEAGGTGLGLSLVRQIAEAHAGGVRCLPREGGGTCFEVTLPLAITAPA